MKKIRKLLCLLMAISMLASVTLTVAAADYEAETYADLETAFAATNNAEGDTTVNVTVKNDINFDGTLTAMKDYTYNVSAAEGTNASLENASFSGETDADGNVAGGTVVIEGMDLSGSYGLQVYDGVNVTVNGNITGEHDGVYATNSTVTVVGNVTGEEDDAVEADYSTVTVTDGLTAGDDGVVGYYSEVTVGGDIDAGYYGVYADNSEVTVGGDIDAESDGVSTYNSEVSVAGDIDAESDGVYADNSEVTVGGDIDAGYYGVSAFSSEVTVGGDIDAESDGVYADNSEVTVGGDITAENDAVTAAYNSTVTVTGDLEGYCGVYAYVGGNVTVNGNISAEYSGVYAYDNSVVSVGESVSAGEDGVRAESSTVSVNGNVTGNGIGAVVVDGNLSVKGSVTGTEELGLGIGTYGNSSETMNIFIGGAVSGSFSDIVVEKISEEDEVNVSLTVGGYDSIEFAGFTDAQKNAFIENIKIYVAPSESMLPEQDLFWQKVMTQLLTTEEGSTVTIDAAHRTTMPEKVAQIVLERDLTLIIQWDGGEDITIDASFDAEPVNGVYNLADL